MICLMLLAAAACGSGARDTGSVGYSETWLKDHDLRLKMPVGEIGGYLPGAYEVLEKAMPGSTFLHETTEDEAYAVQGYLSLLWQPRGLRATLMPPQAADERVYEVEVALDGYATGGHSIAVVSFISVAQAERLNSGGPFDPNQVLVPPELRRNTYLLPDEAADQLLHMFFE
jgi:hypothetical protein